MKKVFIATTFVVMAFLIYWASSYYSSLGKWKEYKSLVRLWPQLKKEKIESIRFTQPLNERTGFESESFFQEIITTFSYRVRATDINSWPKGIEIPKENLAECVKIIDKAMTGKRPSWELEGTRIWLGRMLIVTNKSKYIFHVETSISEVVGPKVYGEEWESYDLGNFLATHCFPDRKFNFKYELPPKEQTIAILLYPNWYSPPLAIFGNKKQAEKLLFETEYKDDPNGIQGLGNLYKFEQLRKFGIEVNAEKKIISGLEPKKVFEGREWLEKIMDAYAISLKEAEIREKYFPAVPDNPVCRIVFMTQKKNYWKEIGISDTAVYDDYIQSEKLKAYFDELGLTKELLDKANHKIE
jgi:hypothetical protein